MSIRKKTTIPHHILMAAIAVMATSSLAGIVNWTGAANDGQWNNDSNWDTASAPGANDTVFINNAGIVNTFGLAAGLDITVTGSSTLNAGGSSDFDMGAGTTVRIGSGATLDSAVDRNWRAENFVFDDGAIGASGWLSFYIRPQYNPSFTFNLGATGFTKMDARRMLAWNNYTDDMPSATFAVDFANYTGGAQTIDLIDFQDTGMTDAHFQLSTHSFLNDAGYTANLSFDEANDIIQLNITAIPEPATLTLLVASSGVMLVLRRRLLM